MFKLNLSNTKSKYIFLIIFFIGSINYCFSQSKIVFENTNELLNASSQILVLEDKNESLNFDEILSSKFSPIDGDVANLGISNSTFWVKIPIKNNSNTENLLLELSLPILDNVEFHYSEENNPVIVGEDFPFKNRKYDDPNYYFDIQIPKGKTNTYYLKVKSKEGIQLPIKIGTKAAFDKQINTRNIFSGIYLGIMMVMILYNLFIFFSVKDKSYIYYVIYILLVLITQTCLQGYPFQYLWPNNLIIAKYSLFIFPSLVGIAGLVFMNVFLDVKKYNLKLFKASYLFTLVYLVSFILGMLELYKASQIIMQINAMAVSVFMLFTAIYIVKKGVQPAKYFLLAWSIFLLGVIAFVLKDNGVLPYNNFTRYTMQIGSGIETILLSFALAARINIYKKERIEAVEEKEKVLKEQNVILEQKVEERTKELNQTLSKLKDAQVQLVDSEKMSSLGQLTAGIAHEINNPINFVSSNITPLRQDLEDIQSILSKYEELNTNNISNKLEEIESLKQELDYEYLKTELVTIINGIEDGAKRTTEIVSGLRNFSRLDEGELKLADINIGIKSTLTLIKNKLEGIKIETDLCEKAECESNPGKINQLIMNLVDNAIDAIKKNHSDLTKGLIKIETKNLEDTITIKITDNGFGISDDIKSKIFDPFFTTKDVGEGTGLGLAIVKGIIETHNGFLEIESELKTGTTFLIELPKTKV